MFGEGGLWVGEGSVGWGLWIIGAYGGGGSGMKSSFWKGSVPSWCPCRGGGLIGVYIYPLISTAATVPYRVKLRDKGGPPHASAPPHPRHCFLSSSSTDAQWLRSEWGVRRGRVNLGSFFGGGGF